MARHNYAYTIAFEVKSDHEPDEVTADELLHGLQERIRTLQPDEIIEACGMPFDTFEPEEG